MPLPPEPLTASRVAALNVSLSLPLSGPSRSPRARTASGLPALTAAQAKKEALAAVKPCDGQCSHRWQRWMAHCLCAGAGNN